MTNCYLCAYPDAPHPLKLKDSFTTRSLCKATYSNQMCDRCYRLLEGDYCQVEFNGKIIFSRNTSWLLVDPRNLENPQNKPYFGDFVSIKGKQVRKLINIPKRDEIREFLLNPPEPPFEVAIAESGQKHILYLANTAYSKESFPVGFEQDTVMITTEWKRMLNSIESLLALKFTKTEIMSGDYRTDRLMKVIKEYEIYEKTIAPCRKTRSLSLACYVAKSE